MRWVKWDTRTKARRRNYQVVLEVTGSSVRLWIATPDEPGSTVRTGTVLWREETAPVRQATQWTHLTKAIQGLVAGLKLQGVPVQLILGSDLCVTRVVSGTKNEVERELRALEERCSEYLALGTGENVAAQAARALDAKHHVVWLTVANRRVLRSVIEAVENTGLRVASAEHSMIALARLLGNLKWDHDAPVIFIELAQRGVGLGISFRGQLLLDYRPGGTATKAHIAETLRRHLRRLQRFVDRRLWFAKGRLTKLFLCGAPADIGAVAHQFSQLSELEVQVLDPTEVARQFQQMPVDELSAEYAACVGRWLALREADSARLAPDFMSQWSTKARGPLLPQLVRTFWPAATAAAIAVCVLAGSAYHRIGCRKLERELAGFQAAQNQWQQLQREITLARLTTENLTQIQTHLFWPRWDQIVGLLGRSLPQGVWLERLVVDGHAHVGIAGASHSEDGVFEFVRRLRQMPEMAEVALEGTQPASLLQGPAVRFEVSGRWVPGATPQSREKTIPNAPTTQTVTIPTAPTTGVQP